MVEPWQKLSEIPYKLEFRKISKWTFQLPNGSTHDFDISLNRPVAVVLPLTNQNEVILARQFRPGPGKVLDELPGGLVDEGETPLQAAEREMFEEIGYRGQLEFVGQSFRDAYSTIVLHTFVSRNTYYVQEPSNHESEIIEPKKISLAAFRRHLKNGNLTDVGPAYLALDYLGFL